MLFPSLRLGYLVVPADLVDRFAVLKSVTSRHAPLLDQAVLCDFMEAGHFGRHLRRMREIYAERRDALREGARAELAEWLELDGIEAGLQTSGRLLMGISSGGRSGAAFVSSPRHSGPSHVTVAGAEIGRWAIIDTERWHTAIRPFSAGFSSSWWR